MELLTTHKELLALTDPATELTFVSEKVSKAGFHHVRYRQVHMGVSVMGEAIVHFDATGKLQLLSVSLARELPASVTPVIDETDVMRLAEEAALEEAAEPKPSAMMASKPELLIVPLDLIERTSAPDSRLAWRVRVVDEELEGKRHSEDIYIDANSGAVLLRQPNNRHAIQQYINDCSVDQPPFDCARDYPIDYGNPPVTYYHGRSFDQPARGPHPDAQTVYFGSGEVDDNFDYFAQIHDLVFSSFGLDGANGQGGTHADSGLEFVTSSSVHLDGFDPGGCAGPSAIMYANGTFGFCFGTVVPDIVGHEYGHALVEHQGPLTFIYQGETGSLEESYGDVFGEYAENDISGTNNWILFDTSTSPRYRNLADPHTASGPSGVPYPDRYFDATFECGSGDQFGAHKNSTVVSHAFYLFSEGGEHNGCEIQAQGIEVANLIYFEALSNYFHNTESFNQAYIHSLAACTSAGYSSAVCDELTKALQAVEIDQPGGACSGNTEVAPPCAVNHTGTAVTIRSDATPVTTFLAGEDVWLSFSGATPGRTFDFQLLPADSARPLWQETTPLAIEQGSGTILPDGSLSAMFFTAAVEDTFDILIDGNRDGFYQPWADQILTIVVDGVVTAVDNQAHSLPTGIRSIDPNPAVLGASSVLFSLRGDAPVELRIYDIAGRRVRTLESSRLRAGQHTRHWDGRNDSGVSVSSGIYFVHLSAGAVTETQKLITIR